MGIYFNRQGETPVRALTTKCWHCSASYDMEAQECPECSMANANHDPERAMAQVMELEGELG